MDGEESNADGQQLLQTETTVITEGKSHHSHHHHHHEHHHRSHHQQAVVEENDVEAVELDSLDQNEEDSEREEEEQRKAVATLGNFMFCDSLKTTRIFNKSKLFKLEDVQVSFFSRYHQPSTTNAQCFTKGHKPGRITVSSLFHMASNRENRGADDDGLDDADLTAADGIVRARKDRNQKKQTAVTDNLKITKGDFVFPHRTYKPKCQIAFRVAPGRVPQAVMAERLHRIYKKTDINLVLQTMGIELSDLIPPATYGENNERFYEEMMFRNRTKINGIDKREVLARGGKLKQYGLYGEDEEEGHTLHKATNDSTISSVSSSASPTSEHKAESSSKSSKSVTDGRNDGEEDGQGKRKTAIHPFILSKPPFNAQFPLHFFDNSEFDIRSGEDWCRLGWEEKEKRFYPLPGKAFLPLPLPSEKRADVRAPSEFLMDELLRKTPRLERFRQWLLKERYQRQIKMVGLDPAKVVKLAPSDMEMAIVARLGSTVETWASISDDSVQEIHRAAKRFSQQQSKVVGAVGEESEATGLNPDDEDGEEQHSSDLDILAADEAMEDKDQLNIVYKLRQPRRDDDLSDDDDKKMTQNDDAKRSVSLLSDVFSDLDSLTMMGSDIITNIQAAVEVEATDIEDIDDETEATGVTKRGLWHPVRSYFMGDYDINIPSSPNIDPYEDGMDQFVMDYDKMKKVHIYDWRWVDVAVFDYHPAYDKYFVRSINSPIVYAWVSKIYLCFDAEDPNKHGLRIKDAVKRRFEMENVMRYGLYVDCLPMIDFPNLDDAVMQRIIDRAVTASNLKTTVNALKRAKREINLEFQRNIAEDKFQQLTEKHHKTFQPWVQIPDKLETAILTTSVAKATRPVRAPHEFLPSIHLQNFEFKVNSIQKSSVIYTEEAWKPYSEIMNICTEARKKEIILTKNLIPMHLDDWEQMQVENIEEMKRYLDEEWYELVVENLRLNFDKTTKSWYNLAEPNYDVFMLSKLSNFLQLIKILLQDTIRSIVKDSCVNLMQQVKSYSENIDPTTDWTWGEDLINSEYPPPKDTKSLWILEMYLDNHVGPKYMQPLSSFCRKVYTVFLTAVQSCSKMHSLLGKVMPQMQTAVEFLKSIEETEHDMVELAHNLLKFTKLILIPLESYIRKFQKYKPVWSLDIASYVKKLEEANPSAQHIKKLVEQNKRHMEKLEKEIPSVIKITAFHVVVDHVREEILKRKKNLITAILDSYATKLRKIIQKVQKDYKEMEEKLTLRSDDIEEVMELKGYVEIVPSLVARLDQVTKAAINDYDVFDHFMYQIRDEDVNEKWRAALNSNRILHLGKDATRMLDDDYERLLKVQQSDLSALNDQVDTATLSIAGLATFVELKKAEDACNEIKKVYRTIEELQEQSDLLNRRQKVFGLPLAHSEALARLLRDIEPFKNLWFTALDWLTVQEGLYSTAMDKVDLEQVNRLITEGGQVIGRCIKYFAGGEQIQAIARSIKDQLEDFKPMMPVVETLKKPQLRMRHWQAISDLCGFMVEKDAQSLRKYIELGIGEHSEEITKIGELAVKEYEVESALTKMLGGIDRLEVKIAQHAEYKTPYIIIAPETTQTIQEYIEITEKLMVNPYNELFLEKLTTWEKKIKVSKTNVALWMECQAKWLQMQPTFIVPEAPVKMPVTFKLYQQIDRIWHRLIRLAKASTMIVDLVSNNTTVASLNQFYLRLGVIQKSLEEFFRPKGSDESDDD